MKPRKKEWEIGNARIRDLDLSDQQAPTFVEVEKSSTKYGSDWSYVRHSDGSRTISKGILPSQTRCWIWAGVV